MSSRELAPDGIEPLIADLSGYLVSKLNALGCQRYGIDKDDLLQEIRFRIWKAIKNKNNNIQYLNAYIKKIIYSVFINEINRINEENRALETGGPCLDCYTGSNGHSTAEVETFRSFLVACIDDLKESKRQVIKLNLEGFTFGEIASLNKWSYRKTCLTFYRGIRELKHKMGEKGIHYED